MVSHLIISWLCKSGLSAARIRPFSADYVFIPHHYIIFFVRPRHSKPGMESYCSSSTYLSSIGLYSAIISQARLNCWLWGIIIIWLYSTDFTKWDRFFISGWPALTLASPSLARAQARRDRRRIGCAQRMKWARAPTRFGPGKYTRPNPTWACTQYTVWWLTWMLWTMCHLAGLARLALGKTGRAQLDHIQHHLNSSELI